MAIKRNKVKLDLGSYPPVLLMGERKVGKTTLMYNLADSEYSLDEMLLISCGDEKGYLSLDDIQYEECRKWTKKEDEHGNRGFIQVVDDIVKNNNELGLKMVVIDTLDTLYDIATEEVLKQHYKEKGTICKSINDAFGGFQRGRDRLVTMVSKEIDKLDRMGLAVFILAHTKNKDKTDPLTGEKYEMLTNNLRADYYSPIADSCQMVVNIAIEREINDGVQVGEKRMMFFRNNGLIDCGGRFTNMPEKLELNAENFMAAFKQGVKNSMRKKATDEEIEKMKEIEIKETKEVGKKIVEEIIETEKEEVQMEEEKSEEENKTVLVDQIKVHSSDKEKKKEIVTYLKSKGTEKGLAKACKITDLSADELNELLKKLN